MNKRQLALGLTLSLIMTASPSALAANSETNLNLQQTVETSPMQMGFIDANGTTISHPSLTFPVRATSYSCQMFDHGAPAALLGSTEQKLYVSVESGTANGWQLALRADAPAWRSENGADPLSINDPNDDGCSVDPSFPPEIAYRLGGLMYIDSRQLTLTPTCNNSCSSDGLQSSGLQNFATANSQTFLRGTAPSNGWVGTVSDLRLTQTIPAHLPTGNYHLPMTLTLTEL